MTSVNTKRDGREEENIIEAIYKVRLYSRTWVCTAVSAVERKKYLKSLLNQTR